jgi:hypothetical protein
MHGVQDLGAGAAAFCSGTAPRTKCDHDVFAPATPMSNRSLIL